MTADAAQRAFGEFLRQARERRQLTVEQIASDTKIASRHLDALEQGSVESLPSGMYRRAMLRAYAESVGLDKRAALQQFERTFEAAPREPEPRDTPAVPASASATRAPRAAAPDWRLPLVLVVLGATVVVALISGDAEQERAPDRVSAAVTIPATAPPPVRGAARPAEADAVGTMNTAALMPAALPGAEVNDAPQAAPDAGPPPAAVGATTGGAPPTAPEPAPAARPSEGEIAIVSEPAGARVTIDGTGWGVTPVTVRHLPFGSKRIRVSRDGYASQERAISLSPDRPSATLRLTLEARN